MLIFSYKQSDDKTQSINDDSKAPDEMGGVQVIIHYGDKKINKLWNNDPELWTDSDLDQLRGEIKICFNLKGFTIWNKDNDIEIDEVDDIRGEYESDESSKTLHLNIKEDSAPDLINDAPTSNTNINIVRNNKQNQNAAPDMINAANRLNKYKAHNQSTDDLKTNERQSRSASPTQNTGDLLQIDSNLQWCVYVL